MLVLNMQKQYDASCITPLGQLFFFRMFLLYSTGIKYLRSDIAYLYRSPVSAVDPNRLNLDPDPG